MLNLSAQWPVLVMHIIQQEPVGVLLTFGYCSLLELCFSKTAVTFWYVGFNIKSITNIYIISAHWRFLDFHGQINAQLNRNEAIYHGKSYKRSFLIITLSPLLFRAPQRYLTELEEAWIDEHILEPVWKSLMTKILSEWSDLILWVRKYSILVLSIL